MGPAQSLNGYADGVATLPDFDYTASEAILADMGRLEPALWVLWGLVLFGLVWAITAHYGRK